MTIFTLDELRALELFEGLPESHLRWFGEHGTRTAVDEPPDGVPKRRVTIASRRLSGRMALRASRDSVALHVPSLLETSMPGVFVAGDVRAGSIKRVASAVGEGSMAVMYIHKYLNQT